MPPWWDHRDKASFPIYWRKGRPHSLINTPALASCKRFSTLAMGIKNTCVNQKKDYSNNVDPNMKSYIYQLVFFDLQ